MSSPVRFRYDPDTRTAVVIQSDGHETVIKNVSLAQVEKIAAKFVREFGQRGTPFSNMQTRKVFPGRRPVCFYREKKRELIPHRVHRPRYGEN